MKEYHTEEISFGVVAATEHLEKHLNNQAQDGWQLVALHRIPCLVPWAGQPPVTYELIWERDT